MNWKIYGKRIVAPNRSVAEFEFPVKETVDVGAVLVVLLDVPPDKVMSENVFGVSKNGEILWQIERVPEIAADSASVYTGIFGHDENIVCLGNWIGVAAEVDARNGKVIRNWITK